MKKHKQFWLKWKWGWGLLGMALLLVSGCGCGPGKPLPPPTIEEPPEPEPPRNRSPVVSSLTAVPTSVEPGGSSTVTVVASDPDGDPLRYSWIATGGTLSPASSRSSTTWTAPSSPGSYTITINVTDGRAGSTNRSVNITVIVPPPPPAPARQDSIGVENWREVPVR